LAQGKDTTNYGRAMLMKRTFYSTKSELLPVIPH